jgi:LytS/YehU family sensor histidine kinase
MSNTSTLTPHRLRLLVVSVLFGLIGLLMIWAKLFIVIPGFKAITDARSVFVLLGAALTGPVGGVITGAISALADPPAETRWFSVANHAATAMFIGWAYVKFVVPRRSMTSRLLSWAMLVTVFYFVLPIIGLYFVYLVDPQLFVGLVPPNVTIGEAYLQLTNAWLPEYVLTLLVTSAADALPNLGRRTRG